MKNKEQDKRLLIPSDAFEEEASEGLGRLTREEATEDLHDLKKRLEKRYSKPLNIWIPAAAAVTLILIASGLYVGLFRNPPKQTGDYAELWAVINDTALIAMAEPVIREEVYSDVVTEALQRTVTTQEEMHEAMALPVDVASQEDEEAAEGKSIARKVVIIEALPQKAKAGMMEKKTAAGNQPAALMINHPLPVGGTDAFDEYVQRNIRYPEEVVPRVYATVTVTFTVAFDSTLKDLRAEVNPGEAFTAEVFRLLKEGPKWIPVISNGTVVEDTVRITILFR